MKKIRNLLQVLLFFMIVVFLMGYVMKVTERKDSQKKYNDFMELSNQIDVLFLGSSHMLNAINPIQLYAEYGITSYNMGKHGGMVTDSYWTLMNALDYSEPKCVVVDLWALNRDYKYHDIMSGTESEETIRNNVSLLHQNMDVWPLSKTKIAAVYDLISDREIRKEFLFEFSLYHSRWSSLEQEDFEALGGKIEGNYLLGANQLRGLYANPKVMQAQDVGQTLSEPTVCVEYLYKIIEECKNREIDIVLTFLPMAMSYDQDWQAVHAAQTIADEQGIPFINLLPHQTQTVIDFYTDMNDDSHLNANGMRKMTTYIGGTLKNLYSVPDHRCDAQYEMWDRKVAEWYDKENSGMYSEKDLYTVLGQIQNMNTSCLIFLKGESKALYDATIRRFVRQLTGTTVIDEAYNQNGPYMLLLDATNLADRRIYEFAGEAKPDKFETILGTTTYIGLKEFAAVYVNEDFDNNYLNMEEHYGDEVQIVLLGKDGEVVSKLYYSAGWKAVTGN